MWHVWGTDSNHWCLQDAVTFSDDDDDLDLGIDDGPATRVKEKVVDKPGGGIMDSLFGKSSSVEKHLQRPGTGGSQREFNLSSENKGPAQRASTGENEYFILHLLHWLSGEIVGLS